MCDVNPDYKPYVQYFNGEKVLYVRVLRAIYVCIEPDMLCYNIYIKTLKDFGFRINTYDIFVDKKMIDRKQFTIVWYVD